MQDPLAQTLPDILDETKRLIDQAERERLNLRLIGGLAVCLHSPHVGRLGFHREYPDIDFVAHKSDQQLLTHFFTHMGYAPDNTFNTLNGDRRQIYYDIQSGRHIDIFVGDFEMCHKLPMRDRLLVHPTTVPLAELFLSKSQIVQLNRKDAFDMIALLLDNELSFSDDQQINLDRIARLCAKDWGLYTTTMINLGRLEQIVRHDEAGLSEAEIQLILQRITTIRQALQSISKSLLWKARDRLGTRLRWYSEVEEINR
jgi:hypothetical protein